MYLNIIQIMTLESQARTIKPGIERALTGLSSRTVVLAIGRRRTEEPVSKVWDEPKDGLLTTALRFFVAGCASFQDPSLIKEIAYRVVSRVRDESLDI